MVRVACAHETIFYYWLRWRNTLRTSNLIQMCAAQASDYKNKNKKAPRARREGAECMNKDIGQIAINEMFFFLVSLLISVGALINFMRAACRCYEN